MYQIGFFIYISIFRIVSIFNKKARKMVVGHRDTWRILQSGLDSNKEWLWFHAASLGEFEQGRPIMEKIRSRHPEYSIILTFYSPSGYEVRKDYKGADIVCYLPFDTKIHVKRFIKKVNPKIAFFIKYEFWPNYLHELKKKNIPTYLISGAFRKEQLFFKSYGSMYRNLLRNFTYFFVQEENSVSLLNSLGYKSNVGISGDTRFDRVLEIMESAKQLEIAEAFVKNKHNQSDKIMIAGSSWPKDEALLIPYFNAHNDLKLIIAPHEIHEEHIQAIEAQLKRPSLRYTKATPEEAAECECLIIDCFGLLSSIYRYGDIAYIGGGFGAGIHNTLEAAVYGIPVLFGPNYGKFNEAKSLITCGGGFCIENEEQLSALLDKLISDDKYRLESGKRAGEMVRKGSGGTEIILNQINL